MAENRERRKDEARRQYTLGLAPRGGEGVACAFFAGADESPSPPSPASPARVLEFSGREGVAEAEEGDEVGEGAS